MDDVVILTMSEFGRAVAENGNRGTDHGHGNAMMIIGGQNVRGGKVYGRWPGLAREQRYDGRDLAVTTDFRSVFAEVVQRPSRRDRQRADISRLRQPAATRVSGIGLRAARRPGRRSNDYYRTSNASRTHRRVAARAEHRSDAGRGDAPAAALAAARQDP